MLDRGKIKHCRALLLSAALVFCASVTHASGSPCKTTEFNPKTYKGKTGTITVPYAGESMLYLLKLKNGKPCEEIIVKADSKKFAAPVGSYKLGVMYLTVTDRHNAKWKLSCMGTSAENLRPVEVKEGVNTRLAVGEPLVASVEVSQRMNNVGFDLNIVNKTGENCTIEKVVANAPAPKFKVMKEGREVMSGAFEFG